MEGVVGFFFYKEKEEKIESKLNGHLFLVRAVLLFFFFFFIVRLCARTRRTKGDEETDDVVVTRLNGPLNRCAAFFIFDLKDGSFADETHDRGHRP